MSPNGRLTLPAEMRQRLGLDGETEFDVEVTERHRVERAGTGRPPHPQNTHQDRLTALMVRSLRSLTIGDRTKGWTPRTAGHGPV